MWWRDEFLANDRVAERDRLILAGARTRALRGEDLVPQARTGRLGGLVVRRSLARLMAATARAAAAAASRLDPEARARA